MKNKRLLSKFLSKKLGFSSDGFVYGALVEFEDIIEEEERIGERKRRISRSEEEKRQNKFI